MLDGQVHYKGSIISDEMLKEYMRTIDLFYQYKNIVPDFDSFNFIHGSKSYSIKDVEYDGQLLLLIRKDVPNNNNYKKTIVSEVPLVEALNSALEDIIGKINDKKI